MKELLLQNAQSSSDSRHEAGLVDKPRCNYCGGNNDNRATVATAVADKAAESKSPGVGTTRVVNNNGGGGGSVTPDEERHINVQFNKLKAENRKLRTEL